MEKPVDRLLKSGALAVEIAGMFLWITDSTTRRIGCGRLVDHAAPVDPENQGEWAGVRYAPSPELPPREGGYFSEVSEMLVKVVLVVSVDPHRSRR